MGRKSMMVREKVWRSKGQLKVLLVGMTLLLWSAASFAATPTLGPDCGAGASIVGSDSAGKVELGTDASHRSTCTLTFASLGVNAPACMAVNETNGGGYSTPVGTRTTTTTVVLGGALPWLAGDVVSYICVGY